jgi:hypothetical protein
MVTESPPAGRPSSPAIFVPTNIQNIFSIISLFPDRDKISKFGITNRGISFNLLINTLISRLNIILSINYYTGKFFSYNINNIIKSISNTSSRTFINGYSSKIYIIIFLT